MWFEMRREDLGFVGRAPLVRVSEAALSAPRAAVFAALVDENGWDRWFPNVRAVAYRSAPPHGVGSIREANVAGTTWVEEILAWDGTRWGWTVLRATVPLASALVETFEVADAGSGTRVRWTFAIEPRLLARLGAPFAGRTLQRVLERAMQNLDVYLGRATGTVATGGR